MSKKTQRINIILTRTVSPTEFWVKTPTDDHSHEPSSYSNTNFNKQKTYHDYLRWKKGIV